MLLVQLLCKFGWLCNLHTFCTICTTVVQFAQLLCNFRYCLHKLKTFVQISTFVQFSLLFAQIKNFCANVNFCATIVQKVLVFCAIQRNLLEVYTFIVCNNCANVCANGCTIFAQQLRIDIGTPPNYAWIKLIVNKIAVVYIFAQQLVPIACN